MRVAGFRCLASGVLLALAITVSSCTGAIGLPGSDDPGQTTGTGGGDAKAAGPMPLTRLNRREFNNTVRDLLGDTTSPADQFPDDRDPVFSFRRAGIVAQQDADLLSSAAESLAAAAVSHLSTLLPCDPATGEQACAGKFVDSFGLRAYRRPLAAAEKDRLMTLYATGRGTLQLGFNDAIGLLIQAMLQAPAFLYHWESPYDPAVHEGNVVRLGPYQLASRLSYFLWGSMPDQALFDAAAGNHLSTDAEIEAQARRMLDDPRARDSVAAFFNEWLDLDNLDSRPKDLTTYPDYTDAVKTALDGETAAFVGQVVFDGDGRFDTVLTADYAFVNKTTSVLYGMSGVQSATLQKTPVDTSQRRGLLTQPAFLALTGAADGSHPVKRGRAVYEKLMCGVLPPPPANVPPAKPASAGGSTRQRFTEHDQNTCAQSCHNLMDPIGFAFEHYDGVGHYRTVDNGVTVDATGQLTLDGTSHSFADATELAGILAGSDTVKRCFATQWLRFAFGRPETSADAASVAHAAAGFTASQDKVRDLMVAVTTSRSFRYRSPAAGETR